MVVGIILLVFVYFVNAGESSWVLQWNDQRAISKDARIYSWSELQETFQVII